MTPAGSAIELRQLTVRFGAATAVAGASLRVARGEIHALVGENGAGKSTLMRALFGLVPLAGGEVYLAGERIARPSPEAAIRRGCGMVHQHFLLVDELTVAENVVLGHEPGWAGWLDRAAAEAATLALATRHRLPIDPRRRAGDLTVGERQRVEILKALYRGAGILVLDEPTAVLSPPEVVELGAMLEQLKRRGGAAVLVTHKLDEVMAICDRVTVLRQGEVVMTAAIRDTTPAELSRAMVGRDVAGPPPRGQTPLGKVRLAVEALSTRGPRPLVEVSFDVRGGEILGIAGIAGNGQTELCEAIAGLAPIASGVVRLDGVDVSRRDIASRRRCGLAHIPEDRQRHGLVIDFSSEENFLLGSEDTYRRAVGPGWLARLAPRLLDRARLRADATRLLDDFAVRPAAATARVGDLSGGNQQKIVVARELARRPGVVLAAQPTRGVDVGAIERIHLALDGVRRGGGAVLLVSAELDELRQLADRIAVLHRGRLVQTLERQAATPERLTALMTGAETA